MTNIKEILTRYGYGKLMENYTDDEAYQLVAKELLGNIDLTKSFEENEADLKAMFYERNGLSIHFFITNPTDIKLLYDLFQAWSEKWSCSRRGSKSSTLTF